MHGIRSIFKNCKSTKQAPYARGFTLVELMVVVAIVGILAALAAPAFSELMQKNRLSAAASALQVSLNLARSEAVKRGGNSRVTVAANTTAGAWASSGWTVFVDGTANANSGVAPSADTSRMTRLEVVATPSSPISVSQTGSLDYFTFNGSGRVINAFSGTTENTNRSFWFFDNSGTTASEKYCLILSISGRVRVARANAADDCPAS